MDGSPVETFPAKRLLTPTHIAEKDFFAAEYNMNLYRGCNHGCIYCDTRSDCYRIDRFNTVRCKENCIAMLEQELRQKRRAAMVSMGAASDPYNALESGLGLTRRALELLKRYHFGVGITTKGTLIDRDANLLAEIGKSAPVRVAFSITTAEDELSALIEPGAPSSSHRFAALAALAEAGVYAGVWINPMLPFLTDSPDNLLALLKATAECGGRFAVCHFGMTLRTGNREYFYAALDREPRFQGLKKQYAEAFGLSYVCASPQAEDLYALFKQECKRLGLSCRFEDINRAMGESCPRQMSLF
jgi:DNA repair photolyase